MKSTITIEYSAGSGTTSMPQEWKERTMRIKSAAFPATLLVGVMIFLPACATTGRDRATKTTTSIEAVEADYKKAYVQIDATNASLRNLTAPVQQDVKKSFNDYAANVKKTEDMAKRLYLHTEQMTARRDAYFTEWESAYTNPEIRKLSEQRRIEMRAVYAQIPEASIGVRGDLETYVTDVKEIQMYLANDLTPQGIEAIVPVSQKAMKDGETAKESIDGVLTAIGRVKGEMVQGGMKQ